MLRLLKKESFEYVKTLQDVREAKVKHEIYGNFDLEFKSSENLSLWDRISIFIQGKEEHFYITKCKKDSKYNSYYAKHISELLHYKIEDFNVEQADFEGVKEKVKRLLVSHGFSLEVVGHSTVRASFNAYNRSIWEILTEGEHSICGVWGGYFLREDLKLKWCFTDVKKTDVLVARRKNIVDFLDESSLKDFATRLKVRNRFSSAEDTDVDSEGQVLFTVVDSPLIQEYPVVIEQALNLNMEEYDTEEKLSRYAHRLFKQGKDKPQTHFSFTPTPDIMEKGLCIGGSALIYYEHQRVYDRVRLTSFEYDPMNQTFSSLGFGASPKTLENVINRQIKQSLSPVKSSMEKMQFKQNIQKNIMKKQQADLRQQAETFESKISKTLELVEGTKEDLSTRIYQTAEVINLTANKVSANERSISSLEVRAGEIVHAVGEVKQTANSAYEISSRMEQRAAGWEFKINDSYRLTRPLSISSGGIRVEGVLHTGALYANYIHSHRAYVYDLSQGNPPERDRVPGG